MPSIRNPARATRKRGSGGEPLHASPEVLEFLRARTLLPSIRATIDLFREVFQGKADYELYLTGGYEEDDDEGVAFNIRFIGPLAEFQTKYDRLVHKWCRVIPDRDQDRMALTWHLN